MDRDTRNTIYAGVNFIVTPRPVLTTAKRLEFLERLEDAGIEFTNTQRDKDVSLLVDRTGGMPLQIKIGAVGPDVGQVIVIAPSMGRRSLETFGAEARDVTSIFSNVWDIRQIVTSDSTIRDLYETTSEHAFKEIWEERLGQTNEQLSHFGRPVLGGGLRFVMPTTPDLNQEFPDLIEVKIESFLQDSKKIFLDTQCTWQRPAAPGAPLEAESRIEFVDNYICNQVLSFLMEDDK